MSQLLRVWAKRIAGAAALAMAAAAVYLAVEVPLREPHDRAADPEQSRRRAANPAAAELRHETTLSSLSRIHVAARVNGFASITADGGMRLDQTDAVQALIDTGSSLAFATPEGERRFGLRVGGGTPVVSRSFAGTTGKLFVFDDKRALSVSLWPSDDPAAVLAPIRYVTTDRVEQADVVMPPLLLAPAGGAVVLDFSHMRLIACETPAACVQGPAWSELSVEACSQIPELMVLRASVEQRPVRLMLDTGNGTLLSSATFSDPSIKNHESARRQGTLAGSAGARIDAEFVEGAWDLVAGAPTAVHKELHGFWVTDVHGASPPCSSEGSLGIDALSGCELALADSKPPAAWLRCAPAP